MQVINTRLLSHPLNWLTVILMLFIAGIGGHYLLALFDQDPATKSLVTPSVSTDQLTAQQRGE